MPWHAACSVSPTGWYASLAAARFMPENVFDELKLYLRFGKAEEAALRAFAPLARPHFDRIVDDFYARVAEHPNAHRVFHGQEQVARHKLALRDWLETLLEGPWNDAYYERRARIGRVHVQIALPQRFMFGAMNLIRTSLDELVGLPERAEARRALHKLLDLELAIMLESYGEAYIDRVQQQERLERDDLQRRLELSEARYEEIVEKAEALIATFDRQGRVQLFNTKCERLTGVSRAAAIGRSWLELFVPASDRAHVHALHERALSGRTAGSYEGSLPVTASGQCRVRWHFTTLPDGVAPALCAIGLDVSNEHELGIRTRRAERLAALGTMAAGLAHEIRNPLNAAHLQLSVAERRLQRADADVEGAKTAVSAA
ncbi:MAG TPA: protoglobin domain-containing protein, partial [Polyangiales bacterium]|nr:protoglobin domain-containing protein [Polyangiales bacterium]